MFKFNPWIFFRQGFNKEEAVILNSRLSGSTQSIWKKPSHDKRGFVLVFMTVFLILAMLITLSLGSSLLLLRSNMQTVHQCRQDTLNIQKEVQPLLERLLSLNPLAKTLRAQKALVEAQLAIAIATLNEPLIASLSYKRRMILLRQKILHKQQKSILLQANKILTTQTLKAQKNLRNQLRQLDQQRQSWGESHSFVLSSKIPKLAVKPSDRRMAPTYEPIKDFEKHQTVSLFWIQNLQANGLLKTYSFAKPKIKSQCHATLEENTWIPKIRRDKRF